MSRNDLMMKYIGLVRALAWKIHRKLPRHVEVDDLVAYGHLGLAEASRSFDESRGLKFSTFAYHRIRGAIFDGLQEMNWFKVQDYHAGEYEPRGNDDKQQDDNATAKHRAARAKRRAQVLSIAQIQAEQGDTFADPSSGAPDAPLQQREIEKKLWEAIERLPAEMKMLIRWVYYDGLTLKEAGERLGHTKSWSSRLHAAALKQMQHGMSG